MQLKAPKKIDSLKGIAEKEIIESMANLSILNKENLVSPDNLFVQGKGYGA